MSAAEASIPIVVNEPKEFRLQNQKMILTYKTHIPKLTYKEWLGKMFPSYKIKFIEIAHETGDEHHPYLHSHVLIDWGKAFQSKNSRVLDCQSIHPHINLIKTKTHWRNAVKYLAKEDPELAHLRKIDTPLVDNVWSCETLEEALTKCVNGPTDVAGIITLFKLKPEGEKIPMPYEPHEWQNQLYDILNKPTSWSNRHVIWVYEKIGNSGKSYFGKYWARTDPKRFYYVNQIDGARNFATIVKTAVSAGWSGHCMIFDLTRSHVDHSIYIPLEMIKSGMVTTTKYEGGTIDLGHEPHVVVFANWPPDVSKLSLDRWRIFNIRKSEDSEDHSCQISLKLHALNIKEARADCVPNNSNEWTDESIDYE